MQGMMNFASVKIFVRGRFQGSNYSALKFCTVSYKYNKNTQELGHNDLYVMIHWLRT